MSSIHLVDPELVPAIEAWSDVQLDAQRLEGARATINQALTSMTPPLRPDVTRAERSIPGPRGAPEVRVIVFAPKETSGGSRPGILEIHGGGYVMGVAEMSDGSNMTLAAELGATVVAVDYRLAPENPHPAPVEDCYAALAWLFDNATELGVDPGRIAITGGSAGGGLAAALALLARDRKEYSIAYQCLNSPMLDDRAGVREDRSPFVGEFVFTAEDDRFGWRCLLGTDPGGPHTSPYASAARAEDLSGLPATYLGCGALDLFVEGVLDYSRRLVRAGVPTEVHIYPGAHHGAGMVQQSYIGQCMSRDSRAALKRALFGG